MWANGSYLSDPRITSWVKIKNRSYSQMERGHELFERRSSFTMRPPKPSLALTLR